MLFTVPILCMSSPEPSIGATPEWAAYKAELAKHRTIRVGCFMASADGEGSFQLTLKSNGDFDLTSTTQEVKWIHGKGIRMDHRKKTWRPITKVDDYLPRTLSMLGLLKVGYSDAETDWQAAWRQTRELYAGSGRKPAAEVGYAMSSYHIDAGFAETWWFDTKTHLVTQIEMQSMGPMAKDSIERSRYIQFEFDKAVNLDLSPTKGYQRAK
jgi:hypothetical protein